MNKKTNKKKETGLAISGIKCALKGLVCMVLSLLITSYIASRSDDPAQKFLIYALVSGAVGGIACSAFSAAECKNDAFVCSSVASVALTLIVAVGSLFFDNAGKELIYRIAPPAVILLSSVVFGLLFKAANGKKRRSLR